MGPRTADEERSERDVCDGELMPTTKVRWRESEVSRLIRAARKVGVQVRVEIRPDGTLSATPVSAPEPTEKEAANEWDKMIP
jgi:hypothetical protein